MTDKHEYVGNAEFEGYDIAAESTVEDWRKAADDDFEMSRFAATVLSMDDKQLEKWARRTLGETDEDCAQAFLDLCEWVQSHKTRFEHGVRVMDTMKTRLLIIADRLRGRQDRYIH